jgi:hypothetical protein
VVHHLLPSRFDLRASSASSEYTSVDFRELLFHLIGGTAQGDAELHKPRRQWTEPRQLEILLVLG